LRGCLRRWRGLGAEPFIVIVLYFFFFFFLTQLQASAALAYGVAARAQAVTQAEIAEPVFTINETGAVILADSSIARTRRRGGVRPGARRRPERVLCAAGRCGQHNDDQGHGRYGRGARATRTCT
jgi:hypothetical protein